MLLLGFLWWSEAQQGSDDGRPEPGASSSGLPTVDVEELPAEAHETIELIEQGGPFPHDEDGSTFRNDEGLLPDQPRGYYEEYTVETPGSDDRGARRIVTGGDTMYWTEDHYSSFARIVGTD